MREFLNQLSVAVGENESGQIKLGDRSGSYVRSAAIRQGSPALVPDEEAKQPQDDEYMAECLSGLLRDTSQYRHGSKVSGVRKESAISGIRKDSAAARANLRIEDHEPEQIHFQSRLEGRPSALEPKKSPQIRPLYTFPPEASSSEAEVPLDDAPSNKQIQHQNQ